MEEMLKRREPFLGKWELEEYIGSGAWGEVWKIRAGEERAALKVTYFSVDQSMYDRSRFEGMTEDNLQFYMDDLYRNCLKEYDFMQELRGQAHIVQVYEREISSMEPADEEERKESFPDTNLPGEKSPGQGLSQGGSAEKRFPDAGWMILYRMDLLEPLAAHLSRVQLTIPEIVRIGIHICRALDACRAHDILHRDIAPGNIFYAPETDTYLLGDFGMAEKAGGILPVPEKPGTYAPPEVYLQNQYSYQSDLYQLGVILYRMLNDFRIPFLPPYPSNYTQKDRSIALFRRYQGEMPPLPAACISRKAAELTLKLGQIVMKAIAPDLHERYADSAALREDLETLV